MRAGFDGKRRPIKKELTKNKNVFDFLFILKCEKSTELLMQIVNGTLFFSCFLCDSLFLSLLNF
jgi:hypothetical protein